MLIIDFTSSMYISEEKNISMKRLNIFIGLSIYLARSQANRSGITLLQTSLVAIRLMFSKESLILYLPESHEDPEASPYLINNSPLCPRHHHRSTQGQVGARPWSEALFQYPLPTQTVRILGLPLLPRVPPLWLLPLPPPAHFSWTMSNVLAYATLHHHHLPFQVLLPVAPGLCRSNDYIFSGADKLIHYLIQLIRFAF